ncbi:MAG: hypothetical protein AAGC55_30945, partial [Myxococcota bacterium]
MGVVTAALASPGGLAVASPLEDTTVGGAVFTGPTHADATSIYVNPAAIGRHEDGTHIYLGGSLRIDRYDIARQRVSDSAGTIEPAGPVSSGTLSPGGMFAAYSVGGKISAGAAVSVPMTEQFLDT